jgi:hypothetical protein
MLGAGRVEQAGRRGLLQEAQVSFFSRRFRAAVAAAGLAAGLTFSAADPASAASPFRPFLGSWRGTGQITGMDGRREPISCRATYEGGDDRSLSQVLVCASDAFRLNIESNVTADGGGGLQGQWRETTRGVQGNLSGQIGSGDFEGQVEGPGFTAQISLRSNGRKQAVYIRPSAGDIQDVNIVLKKMR